MLVKPKTRDWNQSAPTNLTLGSDKHLLITKVNQNNPISENTWLRPLSPSSSWAVRGYLLLEQGGSRVPTGSVAESDVRFGGAGDEPPADEAGDRSENATGGRGGNWVGGGHEQGHHRGMLGLLRRQLLRRVSSCATAEVRCYSFSSHPSHILFPKCVCGLPNFELLTEATVTASIKYEFGSYMLGNFVVPFHPRKHGEYVMCGPKLTTKPTRCWLCGRFEPVFRAHLFDPFYPTCEHVLTSF